MATIATHGGVREGSGELSVGTAVKVAWWTWLVLLLAPFLLFMFVAYRLTDSAAVRDQHLASVWFVGTMIYLIVAAPASFFIRSRLFRPYWKGNVVPPRAYLKGMTIVWLALEVGGILSMVGCLMSNSMLPGMLPGVAAFMFFLPLWPSGHAMTRPNVGNAEDASKYEEPR